MIETNTAEGVVARFRAARSSSITDELILEPGSLRDYHELAMYHYKTATPGAAKTVYRLVRRAPTVVGRYTHRPDETMLVGVLVRSLPHLACRMRDYATRGRYRGLGLKTSAAMVNREFRTISRVVIHPQFRGLGLAVRLMKHALAHPETIFTEALAAMGRVHPFCQRAGMTKYDAPPRNEADRLCDALDFMSIEPHLLASPRLIRSRLAASPKNLAWFERELRRWYVAASRKSSRPTNEMTLEDLIAAARDQLLTQPVYYLTFHGDSVAGGADSGSADSGGTHADDSACQTSCAS